jgi:hypothetical protein
MPPSPTASNGDGRGPGGRFARGNTAGRGNPLAKHAQKLRAALLKSVKPADLKAVVAKMLTLAKAGDTTAAKLVMDRTLGPSEAVDVQAELAELRAAVDSLLERASLR